MHKFLNSMLVIAVLISGFALYSLEHATRGLERKVAKLERDIDSEVETTRFLTAEWSSLTRPDRLRVLAEKHLGLTTIDPRQVVKLDEIGQKVPAEPIVQLEAKGMDPIGAIIEKMR
ncbi:MAG: cell division protein FtsL [Alphaproteobacteria bacterium]|nr:cell division protein FtsL [Alphaproteobacteria bacterium]